MSGYLQKTMIERVIIERDYYDGPKSGIAYVQGIPHRFSALFDETLDEYSDTFLLWPIKESDLRLEVEQWNIFVKWNDQYESGITGTESHPAHGGIDSRWDQLERDLAASRKVAQEDAFKAKATFHPLHLGARYQLSGPDYGVEWKILRGAV